MSAEIFRSLALFITYSIHGVSQKHKGARFDARAKQPRFAHFLNLDRPYLSKTQVGIEVLKAYTNIVCKENGTTNIVKFARTVTNKVRPSLTEFMRKLLFFCSLLTAIFIV